MDAQASLCAARARALVSEVDVEQPVLEYLARRECIAASDGIEYEYSTDIALRTTERVWLADMVAQHEEQSLSVTGHGK
jgi:hypothetical protein